MQSGPGTERRVLPFLAALAFAVSACGAQRMTRRVRPFPSRATERCVAKEDGAIVCEDSPAARVLCSPKVASSCRALGLKYEDDGETVWLYVAPHYDPDDPGRYSPAAYVDIAFASRVVVASDGLRVWFVTRSLSGLKSWHRYEVAAGSLWDVDQADVWKIWASLHEGHAIWLGGQASPVDVIDW